MNVKFMQVDVLVESLCCLWQFSLFEPSSQKNLAMCISAVLKMCISVFVILFVLSCTFSVYKSSLLPPPSCVNMNLQQNKYNTECRLCSLLLLQTCKLVFCAEKSPEQHIRYVRAKLGVCKKSLQSHQSNVKILRCLSFTLCVTKRCWNEQARSDCLYSGWTVIAAPAALSFVVPKLCFLSLPRGMGMRGRPGSESSARKSVLLRWDWLSSWGWQYGHVIFSPSCRCPSCFCQSLVCSWAVPCCMKSWVW